MTLEGGDAAMKGNSAEAEGRRDDGTKKRKRAGHRRSRFKKQRSGEVEEVAPITEQGRQSTNHVSAEH